MIKQLLASAAVCSIFGMGHAQAAEYPNQPVRLVHGFAAGGNADTVSRIIAEPLSKKFGQPFVVEPKPGAGGNVASDLVSRSAPDGYTLQLMVGGHAVSGALYRTLKFDAVKDFTFISRISSFPFFFSVKPGKYADIKALVAAAKDGGRIKFGSAGVGTTQHLTGALLAQKTGANFLHIPYKGDTGALTALLGGEVDVIVTPGTSVLGQAKEGKLKILAVSWDKPWPATPDVPTLAASVSPGFNVFSWVGLGAPKGLPANVTETLNKAMVEIIGDKATAAKLAALGSVPGASSAQEFGDMVKQQVADWNAVIDAAKIPRK